MSANNNAFSLAWFVFLFFFVLGLFFVFFWFFFFLSLGMSLLFLGDCVFPPILCHSIFVGENSEMLSECHLAQILQECP